MENERVEIEYYARNTKDVDTRRTGLIKILKYEAELHFEESVWDNIKGLKAHFNKALEEIADDFQKICNKRKSEIKENRVAAKITRARLSSKGIK